MLATLLTAALAFLPSGQTLADVSGHWQGEITAPSGSLAFQMDIVRGAGGAFTGFFAVPAQGLSESPMTITGRGRDIRIKTTGGLPRATTFTGTISEDGKTITGTFNQTGYGALVNFTLRRAGEARIPARAKSPAVPAAVEGVWSAASATGSQRFTLVIRNQPDGSASATILNAGTEVPAHAVTVAGPKVSVDVRGAGGIFEGTLDPKGDLLSGTWKRQAGSMPLMLRKLPAALTQLQGFWHATEIDGEATGDTEAVIAFFGDTYVAIVDGRVEERGTVQVDASATPNWIDFTIASGTSAALMQVGIVRVTDGTIELAFGAPGDLKRPSSFTAQEARVRFKGRKL